MTTMKNTDTWTAQLDHAKREFNAYCNEGFPEGESVADRIETAARMYDTIRALRAAIDGSEPRGPILSTGNMTPEHIRTRSLARADALERLADEHDGTGFSDSIELRAAARSIRARVRNERAMFARAYARAIREAAAL